MLNSSGLCPTWVGYAQLCGLCPTRVGRTQLWGGLCPTLKIQKLAQGPYSGVLATAVNTFKMGIANPLVQNFLLILHLLYTKVVPKSKITTIFTWLAYLNLARCEATILFGQTS